MKRLSYALLGLYFVACTPRGEETAQEDTSLTQTVDSVSNMRIDGTETAPEVPVDVKQRLPHEIEAYLNTNRKGWELPPMNEREVQNIPENEQGPFFLTADFNGDSFTDYAMQMKEGDSVAVVAFLKESSNGNYREYLLQRTPLHQIEDKKRSIHLLHPAPKSGTYYNYQTKKKINIPRDGISVQTENQTVTYVYENGAFRKYETGD